MNLENQILDEAVKYFKENDGFIRFFEKMKNKLETYEKEATGTVVIDNPTPLEREALSGFMKKDYRKSKSISIKLGRFQIRLNETRFEGVKVKALVQKYFGIEILTKKTRKELLLIKMQELFEKILKELNGSRAYLILKTIIEENKEEYSMLKLEYKSDKNKFEKALRNVCLAINNLPNERLLIPVFSANILKNPHELDKNTLTGRIFILMLAKESKIARPKNTEELSELYFKYNLLIDDLSNMVLCKNIIGMVGEEAHLGWLGFFQNNDAMQVTLAQLAKITKVDVLKKNALVVENPAVFSALSMKNIKIPLVCTYGQVKLSGIVLLNLLVENGVKLYYSGDIDPEGIKIADNLKKRYGEKMQFVGFDVDTYMKNLSKVTLSNQRIKKLDKIEDKELIEVSFLLRDMRVATYEEKNLKSIIDLAQKLDEQDEIPLRCRCKC